MLDARIKTKELLQEQIPSFLFEESPQLLQFLEEYYNSVEHQGGPLDLLNNIDQYVQLNNLAELDLVTNLTQNISYQDTTINVSSTDGFPHDNGLLKINDEIILYKSKTKTSFLECSRGFSGITTYSVGQQDNLVFESTERKEHSSGSEVYNLRSLFLHEFFKKFKAQFAPGFESTNFYDSVNEKLLISKLKDFYSSKGSDISFDILFKSIFGKSAQVIKPRDYVLQASDSDYRVTRDIVVEAISGNPENLVNLTIFQDAVNNIPASTGSITSVEKIIRNNRVYYKISLDYTEGVLTDEFTIHPKTFLTSPTKDGQSFLDVDSTLGFGESGTLKVYIDQNTTVSIEYTSKSSNQFFGCTGIVDLDRATPIYSEYYVYGYYNDEIIKMRISGVLSDIVVPEQTFFLSPNDEVDLITLGTNDSNIRNTSWVTNITPSYNVSSITQLAGFKYRITTIDEHAIYLGDSITLSDNQQNNYQSSVIKVANKNSFDIQLNAQININSKFIVTKNIRKVNSSNFSELNIISANVHNVYNNIDGDETYVVSPSLPYYENIQLSIKDFSITLNGFFDGFNLYVGKHPFYTGDSVDYLPGEDGSNLSIPEGSYYIKKVDDDTISLATSRSNLYKNTYVYVNGVVSNNIIKLTRFANQAINPQKLIKKFISPANIEEEQITTPGQIGMFVNGVEALSYKTEDFVNYGPIKEIVVSTPGNGDYDVINPPNMIISDPIGSGATGVCHVRGSLKRIELLENNYAFTDIPKITITGGNGYGAIAECITDKKSTEVSFGAYSSSGEVDLITGTIGFTTYHRFNNYEKVIYKSNENQNIGGLVNNSVYYVETIDGKTIKLYPTETSAISGINTIQLTSYGSGIHKFRSFNEKIIISSIEVIDGGENYTNKKLFFHPEDVNIYNQTITILKHGYKDKEIVKYSTSGTSISGLSTSNEYYVRVIDQNTIKLYEVGIGTIKSDYYYNNDLPVFLQTKGSGDHELNYQPINVVIESPVGIITFIDQDTSVKIRPVFRGNVVSVSLSNSGINYGDQEIINYTNQPNISLDSGSNAVLSPIISDNGKITDVLIKNSGKNYNSTPTLIVNGVGSNCKLIPIIENGRIVDVIISNPGNNYSSANTSIEVVSAGKNVTFETFLTSWNINLVERLINSGQITDDDGVITTSVDKTLLEYTHAYTPRNLRKMLLATSIGVDGETVYREDYQNDQLAEKYHSPIVGWAYDGNPIYGPYGYETPEGGVVKRLESGYKFSNNSLRPSKYPTGFFVEDYIFVGDGDLDRHNGRYCKTPEFPNGVYAYFLTINFVEESDGPFKSYLKPIFPYIIGDSYYSKKIDYNYSQINTQNYIDLNETGWLRNTYNYNLINENSGYDCIVTPNKFQIQKSIINQVNPGSVDGVQIISEGFDYRVGDSLVFNNEDTGGTRAYVDVEEIYGERVLSLSSQASTISGVEFIPEGNVGTILGICSIPHNLSDGEIITIDNLNNYQLDLNNTFTISSVISNKLILTSDLQDTSITGLTTYISVLGDLSFPQVQVNDQYTINDDTFTILNIDRSKALLKVARSGIGASHAQGEVLFEKSRKFYVNVGYTTSIAFNLNKEIYFNPVDSLGRGSVAGIGTTIFFSYVSYGSTSVVIPAKSIYLPDHGLKTGDKLIYKNNGNQSIEVSIGSTSYPLDDNSEVYVANFNSNIIGIATVPVGINTTFDDEFIEIGGTRTTNDILLGFKEYGTGVNHIFKTNFTNNVTGDITKISASMVMDQSHGLLVGDKIRVSAISGINTTVVIQYNDANRVMVANPIAFSISNVDIFNDTIFISNHPFKTGDKVVYKSTNVVGGLANDKLYYIIAVNNNKIKLSNTHYSSLSKISNLDYIDLTLEGSGTLSKVNPEIPLYRNSTVTFDLSDPSLASIGRPAFSFDLFVDPNFRNKFVFTKNGVLSVKKLGDIGIDENAQVKLTISDDTPEKLYYKLTPIYFNSIAESKIEIIDDSYKINNNNLLDITYSNYNGEHDITGIGTTTISYTLPKLPESSNYVSSSSTLNYFTKSNSVVGSISKVKVQTGGIGYYKLPSVKTIRSGLGTDALMLPKTTSIGKFATYIIQDIGFDYSADKTLEPLTFFPKVFKIEPLSKFSNIRIVDPGVNYYVPPKLIVLDGLTGRINEEVDLRYDIGDSKVTIVRNTTGLYDINPTILPINNPNGTRISNIQYNPITQDVVVFLKVFYNTLEEFPFSIGDRVLIENTAIDIIEGGTGYNSANYGYKLFTLIDVNPDIGGETPTVTYNISDIPNADPGIFDTFESIGTIVPEKYFPKFDVTLVKDSFITGEVIVTVSGKKGIAKSYDAKNEYLKINTVEDFVVGDIVAGQSSKNIGLISEVYLFKTKHLVDASSLVRKGSFTNIGKLSDNLQRLHDNDYYQYFSYSVKSEVSLENWDSLVSNLNHTLGFKKFSNLSIESAEEKITPVTVYQSDNTLSALANLDESVNLNLYHDFDIVREKSYPIDNIYVSDEILFSNPFLQTYNEFIGNRVLNIQNISSQFDYSTREFELYHKNHPIFSVTADGSSGSAVSIIENTITVPNHFFVTGEQIEYIPHDNNPGNAIGIAATDVLGIGITSYLPPRVYVVKVDSQNIQFAATPEDALKFNPRVISLTSVGVGNSHTFRSINPNSRCLITINGVIQSPLAPTELQYTTVDSISIGSTDIKLTGITSIFSGDLLKINNEIVLVRSVGVGSTNQVNVDRAWVGTSETSHISGSTVIKFTGNYNITGNKISFAESISGPSPISTTTGSPNDIDYLGITTSPRFDGRVFLRSALSEGYTDIFDKAYNTNYVFDDISTQFNGITTTFTLKSEGSSVSGIVTSNAIILINDIFQGPQRLGSPLLNIPGNYKLERPLTDTLIAFTGNPSNFEATNDINSGSIPRGGILVSVGSSNGSNYQPLVAAGGTAIVSIAGTIESISIGNSGSGYRSGIQTNIRVGIQTASSDSKNVTYVGYATAVDGKIIGIAITSNQSFTEPVNVIFDEPYSYTNIPLVYSQYSQSGIGTGATVDIVVGQGSSVINFELVNLGYGYRPGDILTVEVGGTTGIPTDTSTFTLSVFEEFQILVDEVYNSKFSGWSIGDIIVMDNIEQYFNGRRRIFPLSRNGERLSFFPRRSSGIEIKYNLLVFINDILQVPGESYEFTGGSSIRFTEAPKPRLAGYDDGGDTCKILMYTGTQTIDVIEVNVLESIKKGDKVQIYSNDDVTLTQTDRVVIDIQSSDSVITNSYAGQGVSPTELLERPINWIKQTEDLIIDEVEVGKSREYYEPNINNQCTIISPVGIGSTIIYVSSVKSVFDDSREGIDPAKNKIVEIIDNVNVAIATAIANVSSGGTISSLTLSNPGYGYSTPPEVSIALSHLGVGTYRATASATVSNGSISTLTITNGGLGYEKGGISGVSVNQEGTGFPPINSQTNTFQNARLNTLTGDGYGAIADITINIENNTVSNVKIISGGTNYAVNDLVYVDKYDSVGIASTYKRYALTNAIIFKVVGTSGPEVLIESPKVNYELVNNVSYAGDYGIIVGVGTTNVGISTGIIFDFYIPDNSPLQIFGYGIYKSGIETGNYFVVTGSSVGYGVTSISRSGKIIGIGTQHLDNVYEVHSYSEVSRSIENVGIVTVVRVVTQASNYYGLNNVTSIGSTSQYGSYSWGVIYASSRSIPNEFNLKTNVFSGISTNPIIRRRNPLVFKNYIV